MDLALEIPVLDLLLSCGANTIKYLEALRATPIALRCGNKFDILLSGQTYNAG
jgi:hypothetical protein